MFCFIHFCCASLFSLGPRHDSDQAQHPHDAPHFGADARGPRGARVAGVAVAVAEERFGHLAILAAAELRSSGCVVRKPSGKLTGAMETSNVVQMAISLKENVTQRTSHGSCTTVRSMKRVMVDKTWQEMFGVVNHPYPWLMYRLS